MSGGKISPHSLPDLKNTSDDALGNYLRGLGFAQDNTKLDTRLIIGYTSVIIAGATFAADYKLGWEVTKTWTAVAVAAYAILNGAYTYWMCAVEKGVVFEGAHKGKRVRPDLAGGMYVGHPYSRRVLDIDSEQDEEIRPNVLPHSFESWLAHQHSFT